MQYISMLHRAHAIHYFIVPMCICTYVHMYTCIYVYMYICTYVYMYICTYVYMYICLLSFVKLVRRVLMKGGSRAQATTTLANALMAFEFNVLTDSGGKIAKSRTHDALSIAVFLPMATCFKAKLSGSHA